MRAIRTSRLRLVPVTAQNANQLWTILQHPDLRMYQDLPNVGAVAFGQMVAKRPKQLVPGAVGRFEWLLYVIGGRKAVGWVSLRIAERDTTTGEVGYSVIRAFRGRGIATEALRVLLGEAFEQAALKRLHAYCVPENAASRRVLEHAGFVRDAMLPHGATVNGSVVDVLMHCLERERWIQSKKSIDIPASAYPV